MTQMKIRTRQVFKKNIMHNREATRQERPEASNKSLEDNKASLEKLDIVKKAFNLDFEAEDIDTMIQEER